MSVISSLGLVMLLTGCASPIESQTTVIIEKLPPAGLIVPCNKPIIKADNPLVTASEDVPKLKAALGKCAEQAEDYLKWRAEHEINKD